VARARFGLAGLFALTALACTGPRDCTTIGAEPGVTFHLRDVLTNRLATVRVCVEDRCVTRQAKIGLWEMIFVPDPTLTGPREVDVSIAVAQPPAENIALVNESAIVQARRYQPNGPGCDPVVFAASVEVGDDGIHQRPQP
jgi:hypothetical protein